MSAHDLGLGTQALPESARREEVGPVELQGPQARDEHLEDRAVAPGAVDEERAVRVPDQARGVAAMCERRRVLNEDRVEGDLALMDAFPGPSVADPLVAASAS